MGRRDRQEQRYRLLFERHWRRLSAYVQRRCQDRSAAEDVVAEVFLVAWRRLDDIPVDNELPWLFGVARRTLANSRRSSIRHQNLIERLHAASVGEGPVVANGSPDPEDQPDDNAARRVQAAFAHLRPVDAEILRLSAWEELTPTQIAVVMRCSPNAAAVRLHRARGRLREALEPQPTPDVKGTGLSGHKPLKPGRQPPVDPPR